MLVRWEQISEGFGRCKSLHHTSITVMIHPLQCSCSRSPVFLAGSRSPVFLAGRSHHFLPFHPRGGLRFECMAGRSRSLAGRLAWLRKQRGSAPRDCGLASSRILWKVLVCCSLAMLDASDFSSFSRTNKSKRT